MNSKIIHTIICGGLIFSKGRNHGRYTTDTVDELIDKTRQAVMANFNPEYAP